MPLAHPTNPRHSRNRQLPLLAPPLHLGLRTSPPYRMQLHLPPALPKLGQDLLLPPLLPSLRRLPLLNRQQRRLPPPPRHNPRRHPPQPHHFVLPPRPRRRMPHLRSLRQHNRQPGPRRLVPPLPAPQPPQIRAGLQPPVHNPGHQPCGRARSVRQERHGPPHHQPGHRGLPIPAPGRVREGHLRRAYQWALSAGRRAGGGFLHQSGGPVLLASSCYG